MIWEILVMVSLVLVAVLSAISVPICIFTLTILVCDYNTYQEKRHWCVASGSLIGMMLVAWVLFSISTVKVRHLENDYYMRLQHLKCSECGEELDVRIDGDRFIVKPCDHCKVNVTPVTEEP